MSFKRNPDVVSQNNMDGTFLLHLKTGTYFGLNESGAIIWEALEENKSLVELASILKESFIDASDNVQGEVEELLISLKENQLVLEA